MIISRHFFTKLLLLCAALLFSAATYRNTVEAHSRSREAAGTREQASVHAFRAMLPVLHHPRCMNCHMQGDFPRQGDDSHPHIMDVRRGPSGHGINGVYCSTCHQDHNLPGIHTPPGAPDWALPPPATPMIWQGLSDHQLCVLLLDPNQNGHRSAAQIMEHMHTPIVLWGFNPGPGRTPIPVSEQAFLTMVDDWVGNGAACPQ
jgi:hypothetical protein